MRKIKIIAFALQIGLLHANLATSQDCKCPTPSMPGLEHRVNKMYYDSVRCSEANGEISCVFACNYVLKGQTNEIIVSVAWVKKAKPGTNFSCNSFPPQYSIGSTQAKLAWGKTYVSKLKDGLYDEAKRIAMDIIVQVEPFADNCPDKKPAAINQTVFCPSGYKDYTLQTNDPGFNGKIKTVSSSGGNLNTIGCVYQDANTKRIIKIQGNWFSTQPANQFQLPNACQQTQNKNIINLSTNQAYVNISQSDNTNYLIAKDLSDNLLGRIKPYAALCPGSLPPKDQYCKCPESYADFVLSNASNVGKLTTSDPGNGSKVGSILCSYLHKTDRTKKFDLTMNWAIEPRNNARFIGDMGCYSSSSTSIVSSRKQVMVYIDPNPEYKVMSEILAKRLISQAEPYALPCIGKLKDELTNDITSKGTVRAKIVKTKGTIEIFDPALKKWTAFNKEQLYLYSGQRVRTGPESSLVLMLIKSDGKEEFVDLGANMSMDMQ